MRVRSCPMRASILEEGMLARSRFARLARGRSLKPAVMPTTVIKSEAAMMMAVVISTGIFSFPN